MQLTAGLPAGLVALPPFVDALVEDAELLPVVLELASAPVSWLPISAPAGTDSAVPLPLGSVLWFGARLGSARVVLSSGFGFILMLLPSRRSNP